MEFYIVQKYISKTNESEIKAFSEKQNLENLFLQTHTRKDVQGSSSG